MHKTAASVSGRAGGRALPTTRAPTPIGEPGVKGLSQGHVAPHGRLGTAPARHSNSWGQECALEDVLKGMCRVRGRKEGEEERGEGHTFGRGTSVHRGCDLKNQCLEIYMALKKGRVLEMGKELLDGDCAQGVVRVGWGQNVP